MKLNSRMLMIILFFSPSIGFGFSLNGDLAQGTLTDGAFNDLLTPFPAGFVTVGAGTEFTGEIGK